MIGLIVGIFGWIFGAFGLFASLHAYDESSLPWWKTLFGAVVSAFLIIEGWVFVLDFFQ